LPGARCVVFAHLARGVLHPDTNVNCPQGSFSYSAFGRALSLSLERLVPNFFLRREGFSLSFWPIVGFVSIPFAYSSRERRWEAAQGLKLFFSTLPPTPDHLVSGTEAKFGSEEEVDSLSPRRTQNSPP